MMEFIKTMYGKRFFDSQLPNLIKVLGRIADALEKNNEPIVIEEPAMNGCNIEEMTREDFKKLFGLKDSDASMENFDALHEETGMSWYNMALMQISQMDYMIRGDE